MADLKDLERMKSRVERLEREIERAKGSREEVERSLRMEFHVADIKEAKELLEELTARFDKEETAYEKAHQEFMKKWDRQLST